MDFDLRQWLLILGTVFIIAVVIHGFFRRRSRNELQMKLDKKFLSRPGEAQDIDDLDLLKAELPHGGARALNPGKTLKTTDSSRDIPVLEETVELPNGEAGESAENRPPEEAAPPGREQSEEEAFVIINVLARASAFQGRALLDILTGAGMALGGMDIFHGADKDGAHIFSLANAVEPGIFDMATMDTLATPGVVMFMRIHEVREPLRVLDEMLAVAETIARELNGEVRDENHNPVAPQTVEHFRDTIREFQFRHPA